MNYVFRAIFVTLMLSLALTPAFAKKVINLSIDHQTGDLLLSDGGRTTVGQGGPTISWVIIDDSITSFLIQPKTSFNIFRIPVPTTPSTTSLDLPVRIFATLWRDWEYGIKWTKKGSSTVYTHDPIIAVRPIAIRSTPQLVVFGLALLGLIFGAVKLFGSRKSPKIAS